MSKSSKGPAFEREICTQLSLWWTRDDDPPRDDVFWRTPNSGGRATTRGKAGKRTVNTHGDVLAIDPIGQPFLDLFVLELKRGYNRATVHDLLDRPKKAKPQVYEQWIAKARRTAADAGVPHWLIVHKRDFREPMVLVPSLVMNGKAVAETAVGARSVPVAVIDIDGDEQISIFPLSAFLDVNPKGFGKKGK